MKDSKDTRNGFKMREKVVTALCTVLLLSMAMGTMVMQAAVRNEYNLYLAKKQAWNVRESFSRSRGDNPVYVQCIEVRPTSGLDNYHKIQTRVVNFDLNLTPMSDTYIIDEEINGYTPITLYEKYWNYTPVRMEFCGNNPLYDAYAAVSYDGGN